MSQGIPVISNELNGVFYDAKKENLKLAEVKDITNLYEIADMIEKIIEDENFTQQIINSGYRIVNKNTWEKVAQKYENLYRENL